MALRATGALVSMTAAMQELARRGDITKQTTAELNEKLAILKQSGKGGATGIASMGAAMQRAKIDAELLSRAYDSIITRQEFLSRQREFRFAPPTPEDTGPDVGGMLGAAQFIEDINTRAEKLAKSGNLEEAANLLITLGTKAEDAANRVVGWANAVHPTATSALDKAIDKIADMVPALEQIQQAQAFAIFEDQMRDLIASGDLDTVFDALTAIGKNYDEQAKLILGWASDVEAAHERA